MREVSAMDMKAETIMADTNTATTTSTKVKPPAE